MESSLYYSLLSAVLIIFPAVPYSIHPIKVSAYRILSNISASVTIRDCVYSEQQAKHASESRTFLSINRNRVNPENQLNTHFRELLYVQHTTSEIFVRSVQ